MKHVAVDTSPARQSSEGRTVAVNPQVQEIAMEK